MEFLAAQPPRCTLVNVETRERFECLLNPEGLSEKISVNYRRHVIPGLGYLDDATILVFCLQLLDTELEKFREWQAKQDGRDR